jgi:hypothetical protein
MTDNTDTSAEFASCSGSVESETYPVTAELGAVGSSCEVGSFEVQGAITFPITRNSMVVTVEVDVSRIERSQKMSDLNGLIEAVDSSN